MTAGQGRPRPRDVRAGDRWFRGLTAGLAVSVALVLVAIAVNLLSLSAPAWQAFGWRFLVSSEWNPVKEDYAAGAFIWGTLYSSFMAVVLALPISVGVALLLTEVLPRKLALVLAFLVEMLAAIPSVVYGLWGMFWLAPRLRETIQPALGDSLGFLPLFQGPPYGIGMMSAGIVLSIMIVPTIAAITREVFLSVPSSQREAVLALGSTRWEMIQLAVLKPSKVGVLSATILGLGRALGETMAVTMVIGNRADVSLSLFSPAQTMASVIANEYAEASTDLHLAALAGVGFTLFLVSLATNGAARLVLSRWDAFKGARP